MRGKIQTNLISRTLIIVTLASHASGVRASQNCLKKPAPYNLAGDAVTWGMTISPGSDCIQGLRWSYMQVYSVTIVKPPAKGRLVVVGSGFRYYADADSHERDSFTLAIEGKNRRESGNSTLQVDVNATHETVASNTAQ